MAEAEQVHGEPWESLRERAVEAMRRAYAPYSSYPVGAAATG